MIICPVVMGQSQLEIEVSNIRNNNGHILFSLFKTSEQFPRNPPKELSNLIIQKTNMSNRSLKHSINSLKPGFYALALLDDENKSGDLESTKIGIPLEGFGFSNNIKPFLSPPPFRKCVFEVKPGKNSIKIEVQYRK